MKKTQFNSGDTEAMAEYAVAQYTKLLTEYDTFQIDDEAVDAAIEEVIPMQIQVRAAEAAGCAIMGCRPLLASGLIPEDKLQRIINRLDAIIEWADAGNEFDIWCEFKTIESGNGFQSGRVRVICE